MFLEIFLGLVAIIFSYGLYIKYVKWTFFERKGILQMPTSFPLGNFNEMIFQDRHTHEVVKEMYKKTEGHKVYGVYFLGMPALTIRDVDLVRRILVKDFEHFVDRQEHMFDTVSDSKTDKVWSRQLIGLMGDEWKDVRSTFSPIFTSGKMKAMMVFIRETTKRLIDEINQHAKSGTEFELRDVLGKFSMDTIASCAFGVDAQSFSSSGESQFVKNASGIFTRTAMDMLRIVSAKLPVFQQIYGLCGFSIFKPKETQFFVDVITTTIRDRIAKGDSSRNDLIDMMIRAMKDDTFDKENENSRDQFDVDSELKNHSKTKKKEFDEVTIVATALLMLIAGYDTTALTMSYAGYQLCKNPEILKQLQEEVDLAYDEANGETPDYNVIQNLPYLDMVIHETLRLHTPVGLMMRVCVKDYEFEGLSIKKGMPIHIPASGIHTDPKFYPDPETFNPKNFDKENKASRSPYTFLGFGQGPRACLAVRFALLEAKFALMSVVRHFDLKTCSKSVDKIVLDPKSTLGGNLGGLWVKAEKRNH